MKGLVALLVLVTFVFLTGVVGAEANSVSIQKYIDKKYSGAELEKYSYYNAIYLNVVGKYEKSLELLLKIKEKYQYSKNMDNYDYYIADNYEKEMKTTQARDIYKQFLVDYPESARLQKVKEKLNALQFLKEK
ncbi:MAG: hypothetical protein WCJ46_07255 [bacterium]